MVFILMVHSRSHGYPSYLTPLRGSDRRRPTWTRKHRRFSDAARLLAISCRKSGCAMPGPNARLDSPYVLSVRPQTQPYKIIFSPRRPEVWLAHRVASA